MRPEFRGQKLIVVGGTSGIGNAVAKIVLEQGGAARGDAVVGFEEEQPRKETVDVRGGGEFGQLAGEVAGEIFGMALFLAKLGMAEAEMRFRVQDAKAAATARGGAVTAEG